MFQGLLFFVLLPLFITWIGLIIYGSLMWLFPVLNEVVAAIFGALFVLVVGFLFVIDAIEDVKIAIREFDKN